MVVVIPHFGFKNPPATEIGYFGLQNNLAVTQYFYVQVQGNTSNLREASRMASRARLIHGRIPMAEYMQSSSKTYLRSVTIKIN